MGKMEKEARVRRRWGQVRYALLAAVGISGVLLVGMAAPNTLKLLRYLPKNKYRFNHRAKSMLSHMAMQGHVRFTDVKGKRCAELTESGKRELLVLEHKFGMLGKARRRWDRRWRVIIFDIPEKIAPVRQRLRHTMKSFGFYRLQDSVWMYPYDCEDVMTLLKAELRLGNAVRYMIVEHIENDRKLREHFELPMSS